MNAGRIPPASSEMVKGGAVSGGTGRRYAIRTGQRHSDEHPLLNKREA